MLMLIIIFSVNFLIWAFSFAYLDKKSRQGETMKLVMLTKKNNVGHILFQWRRNYPPILIRHNKFSGGFFLFIEQSDVI